MTSPDDSAPRPAGRVAAPFSAKAPISVLQHRADFLKAAQARRQSMPGFLLQARDRSAGSPGDVPETPSTTPDPIRIGYTCSKKVGNAVARNRAKRRLRAIAAAVLPDLARPGWDYVLVGRADVTATRDFAVMQADLARALVAVHGTRP